MVLSHFNYLSLVHGHVTVKKQLCVEHTHNEGVKVKPSYKGFSSKKDIPRSVGKSPRGLVANVLGCDIVVSEFKLQSIYDVHFWTSTLTKGMNSLIPQAIGLIVKLLFFYKDGFGIK